MTEDFQLIKRKEFINAENNINADKKEVRKETIRRKKIVRRKSRHFRTAEYNRRQ